LKAKMIYIILYASSYKQNKTEIK